MCVCTAHINHESISGRHTYTYVYVYIYMYMFVYIIYTYMHIHTHVCNALVCSSVAPICLSLSRMLLVSVMAILFEGLHGLGVDVAKLLSR